MPEPITIRCLHCRRVIAYAVHPTPGLICAWCWKTVRRLSEGYTKKEPRCPNSAPSSATPAAT